MLYTYISANVSLWVILSTIECNNLGLGRKSDQQNRISQNKTGFAKLWYKLLFGSI